jgi:hypothetical protein
VSIDDKLAKAIDILSIEGEVAVQDKMLRAAIAGIPYVGGSISSLITGQARQRLVQRAVEVFEVVGERLRHIDESLVDREFFDSEEFQTILALAIQQLQTTHDRRKIRLLASALANSGTKQFASDDRKETFMRLLRELTMDHILRSCQMEPRFEPDGPGPGFVDNPRGIDLLMMQQLASWGLVEESLQKRPAENRYGGEPTVEDFLWHVYKDVPIRRFQLSQLGRVFLAFIEQGDSPIHAEPGH